ncbi:MAG: ribose 1,5-bisphosphate isomerase [Haloferacaceae archaeon]
MDSGAIHPDVEETCAAIESMEIRGAASIADAVARALRTQAVERDADAPAAFRETMYEAARRLEATRPTAVSLPNALRSVLSEMRGESVGELRESVVAGVDDFRSRLESARGDLGRVGANRLADGDTVMTHCHSTDAMACIEAAVDRGADLSAVVKETRPLKQGHITATALADLGVDVTLVVDSAARQFLDDVDHVLVGADSVAADGSVVNKIGTSGLAVNARDRDVPLVVAAQTIKLHPGTLRGETVPIERRDESEVVDAETRAELGDVDVANPAFDVTPPRYVDAVVTEHGQFPPQGVVGLMRDLFGEDVEAVWRE